MTDQPISNRIDRIEASVATHNEILSQLAPLTAQIAQLLAQQTARGDRHDELLNRLSEQTTRNAESLNRLEQRMDQLAELVTTSTTETIRLVADLARQQASDKAEIREIWRYLRYEPRNGNGRSEE